MKCFKAFDITTHWPTTWKIKSPYTISH